MFIWKSGTATFLALSLLTGTVTPILTPMDASAQLFPGRGNRRTNSLQVTIPMGTEIPLEHEKADKILVTEEETSPLTLTVAANVKDNRNRVLIPYGSQLVGQIEPASGGSRFVAKELVFPNGSKLPIQARSEVVTRRETVEKGTDLSSILSGAAIGAAASSIISLITGDRSIGIIEVLGGTGLGALGGLLLGGRNNSAELVSIDPNRDLDVTLDSALDVTAQLPPRRSVF